MSGNTVNKILLLDVIHRLSKEKQDYILNRAAEFKKEFDECTLAMTAASLALVEWDQEHEN